MSLVLPGTGALTLPTDTALVASPPAGDRSTKVATMANLGSEFASFAFSANGYQKLPSGLIIQWMLVTVSVSGYANYSFPTPFPTALLGVSAVTQSTTTNNSMLGVDFAGSTTTQLRAAALNSASNAYVGSGSYRVIAIGY